MRKYTSVTEADLDNWRARGFVVREKEKKAIKGAAPKPRLEFTCEVCGKIFLREIYEVERVNRVGYCSNSCSGIASRKPCPDVPQLLARYKAGQSMNSISKIWQVSDMTIRKWLVEEGVTIREMGPAVSIAQTGKRHSEEWNQAISKGHSGKGINHHTAGRKNSIFTSPERANQRSKGGFRPHLGIYVRSSWENNYGIYLNWLKDQRKIIGWEYEADTFKFTEIKKGCVSYTPDFKITEIDGRIVYHEVKGYMDQPSRTKISRMKKYYPDIPLIIIDGVFFKDCERQGLCRLLPHWECKHKKLEIENTNG